jgi:hypothetical protein
VEAAQRNEELQTHWQYQLQSLTAEQILCVDESGSNGRTGDRHYSWSHKAARAIVRRWLRNRERVSVLPAYIIEGYIAAKIFKGTCTREIIEGFIIDDLLPIYNSYPGPRSAVSYYIR